VPLGEVKKDSSVKLAAAAGTAHAGETARRAGGSDVPSSRASTAVATPLAPSQPLHRSDTVSKQDNDTSKGFDSPTKDEGSGKRKKGGLKVAKALEPAPVTPASMSESGAIDLGIEVFAGAGSGKNSISHTRLAERVQRARTPIPARVWIVMGAVAGIALLFAVIAGVVSMFGGDSAPAEPQYRDTSGIERAPESPLGTDPARGRDV
jgi:hypothetical protein